VFYLIGFCGGRSLFYRHGGEGGEGWVQISQICSYKFYEKVMDKYVEITQEDEHIIYLRVIPTEHPGGSTKVLPKEEILNVRKLQPVALSNTLKLYVYFN